MNFYQIQIKYIYFKKYIKYIQKSYYSYLEILIIFSFNSNIFNNPQIMYKN
jgi:hypothetical protein